MSEDPQQEIDDLECQVSDLEGDINDLHDEVLDLKNKLEDYNEAVERCKWQSSEMAKDSTIIVNLQIENAALTAQLKTYTHGIPIEEADKSKVYIYSDYSRTIWKIGWCVHDLEWEGE